MPDIVLSTLNAKYSHASFGLRCLLANMGALLPRTVISEFDINQRPLDIAERLLELQPRIVGFGVYIWNVAETLEVVQVLKRLRPDVCVVLGGPEVSYEFSGQAIVEASDYVITHEADVAFGALCARLLQGERPAEKIIVPPRPDLGSLAFPYALYTDEDVKHRVVYVEASRGCPFRCEFCLSSLDEKVRPFPLPEFLREMQGLLDRGLKQFKFVDRTFNLSVDTSARILQFFLERMTPGLFVHFEMIPDRLPPALRELIVKFPPGALQFEVGVQTLNPNVEKNISRRQDHARMADNFAFLARETGVHIHADLIVGLPGESVESFGEGFDALLSMGPEEIQVGILKRLRGTPIVRHDAEFRMVYGAAAPYEVLSTRDVTFAQLQQLRRFARYWDLFKNRGQFPTSLPPVLASQPSAFASFFQFSQWLHDTTHATQGLSLLRQFELLLTYRTSVLAQPSGVVAQEIWHDYQRGGRSDLPAWLRALLPNDALTTQPARNAQASQAPKRQAQHLA